MHRAHWSTVGGAPPKQHRRTRAAVGPCLMEDPETTYPGSEGRARCFVPWAAVGPRSPENAKMSLARSKGAPPFVPAAAIGPRSLANVEMPPSAASYCSTFFVPRAVVGPHALNACLSQRQPTHPAHWAALAHIFSFQGQPLDHAHLIKSTMTVDGCGLWCKSVVPKSALGYPRSCYLRPISRQQGGCECRQKGCPCN